MRSSSLERAGRSICGRLPCHNVLGAVALGLVGWLAGAAEIAIRLEDGVFRVTGFSERSTFAVYAGAGDLPPIAGSSSRDGGVLTFRPRYPLAAGVRYRAVVRPENVEAFFEVARAEATTRVEHIYPSVGVLPSNQLKLYIVFSAPMARGQAWRRIRLLDERGKPVELPFLELEQELWDHDFRRLTVLFDPGRIKRGLVPTEEVGPPIEQGKRYTLVVDREWMDAREAPLMEVARKEFRVTAPDRVPPDPRHWHITAPRAGTWDAVVVDFGEPMDFALAERLMRLPGVEGKSTLENEETQWRFVPRAAWRAGRYRLEVDRAIEDLAGNRVGRPFDVDLFERVTRQIERQIVTLVFRVR